MRFKVSIRPSTYLYVAVAILASAPAWIVKYPPLQDMPFHVATLRVVHDFGDPTYAFARDYVLNLGKTQYVLYYLVGSALAYVLGVTKASVALLAFYLAGTPLAMRELLRALGKDERLCLFVIPMLVNTMFIFGFLPFLFGIPLMLLGLARAVRYFDEPTLRRALLLAGLAILIFYSHVFPFAIFGIGFAFLFPWSQPTRWLRAGLPVVPALLLLVWWTKFSDAGKQSSGALKEAFAARPLNESIPGAFPWFMDVFKDTTDEFYFIALILLAVLATGLAQGDPDHSRPRSRMLVFVPLSCALGYFMTGDTLGPVWLFAQRFPVLGLLMFVPLLRFPTGVRGALTTGAVVALGAASTLNVCKHFIKFQLEEVGDVDEAIAHMEPGKRVAALVYDKYSNVLNWAPFLHFGSYYQVYRGGLVQFSYASWSHWPFQYKPGAFPPPGPPLRPRWEWTPEQVPVHGELYPYFDYVLTRGLGFAPPPGTFRLQWRGERWAVWRREGA